MTDESELASSRGRRIGILIVAFNAASTLLQVLNRIKPEVWANVAEVAVFDDASHDGTYELARDLQIAGNRPKLSVLRQSRNLGYGGNQKAGYRYFIEKGFDIVVLLHGDGQYAPEILSDLYRPIVNGEAHAVFGSRMMKTYGGALKGGMPLYKYAGNRVLTILENRLLNLKLTEFHSGYRAYDLHALAQIDFDRMTDDFHFDTEIIIKLNHQKFTIAEVPIPTYYGGEICYVNGMKYAKDVVRALYRYRRTRRGLQAFPEFQEYFAHYPLKLSQGSSHDYVVRMAGSGQTVLDIGCGEGHVARRLNDAGNIVTGVDTLAEPSELSAFDRYYRADLDDGLDSVIAQLNGKRFSRVLLLDILEHLRAPERILRQCPRLLQPDGRLIVSVPNIANITVRAKLLLGIFNYADRGILDRTHLRFFTRRTARRMLESCGYKVVREKLTVMPVELVLGTSPNLLLRALTRALPGLFGYQIMLEAEPASAPVAASLISQQHNTREDERHRDHSHR